MDVLQKKFVLERREKLYEEIAEYLTLKQTIEKLKEADVQENLKTQMDIGCNFYVQAVIPDPKMICVKLSYGFFAEFTLDEALTFVDKKIEFLNCKVETCTKESCSIKAKIKLVLEGLAELQRIDTPLKPRREIF